MSNKTYRPARNFQRVPMRPVHVRTGRRLVGSVITVAVVFSVVAATAQTTNFVMPPPTGFSQVKLGTPPSPPTPMPGSHPSSMVVSMGTPAKAGASPLSIQRTGRSRVGAPGASRQTILFVPDGATDPWKVILNLPIDLSKLMPKEIATTFRYEHEFAPPFHDRTMTIGMAGRPDNRLQVITRQGDSPVTQKMDSPDVDVGISGLIVSQGDETAATPNPVTGFSHALPVRVRTRDGTETWLWQGDRIELQGDHTGTRVNVLVLVSQVAKPGAGTIHVAEGTPFTLELLVVSQVQ